MGVIRTKGKLPSSAVSGESEHLKKSAVAEKKLQAMQAAHALMEAGTTNEDKHEDNSQTSRQSNVSRSKSVLAQIRKAEVLKEELIAETVALFPKIRMKSNREAGERKFLRQIERSAESFDVVFRVFSPDKVDRTASMLSGPFFTTKKHPIPTAHGEMMYPIVQIDLRVASELVDEELGDGLLQLWYENKTFEGVVRVIPRTDVVPAKATDFAFTPPEDMDGFPLPFNWNSDPLGEEVRVISKFKSTGVSSQDEYPEIYLDETDVAIPDTFFKLLTKFEKLTLDKGDDFFHMFGTFYPIQYSAADVKGKCLCHIGCDWGSSGNAQIFYVIDKNKKVSFWFGHSMR